jgi:hypothetical protein
MSAGNANQEINIAAAKRSTCRGSSFDSTAVSKHSIDGLSNPRIECEVCFRVVVFLQRPISRTPMPGWKSRSHGEMTEEFMSVFRMSYKVYTRRSVEYIWSDAIVLNCMSPHFGFECHLNQHDCCLKADCSCTALGQCTRSTEREENFAA